MDSVAHETRADPHGVGTSGERSSHGMPGANTASPNYRQVRDGTHFIEAAASQEFRARVPQPQHLEQWSSQPACSASRASRAEPTCHPARAPPA